MVPRTDILGLSRTNLTIRGVFVMSASSMYDYTCLTDGKQHPDLSDVSPEDRPWDQHKASNEEMTVMLSAVANDDYIARIRERMQHCAPWLVFAHTVPDERQKTFKLHRAEFCRVRTCPVCGWRRSMLYVAKLMKAVPSILQEFPSLRLLHLTLTVKNCAVTELRSVIKEMNSGWQRLSQRAAFRRAVKGYVRCTEVSWNPETDEAHPHFHVMLLVPEYYFKVARYYIKQEEWVTLWQQCARLDYRPSVHIKAFRQNSEKGLAAAVHEVAKYTTKPSDLLAAGTEWLVAFIHQIRELRFFATGGVVKKVLGEVEKEYEDLIKVGEDQTQDDSTILAQSWFDWKREVARYQHKETRLNPNIPTNHIVSGGGGGSGGGSGGGI